jgi:hypothetical protein
VALRDTANENQRRNMHESAAHQYRMAVLREEFESSPRAYVTKYGSINSVTSTRLVEWLLERIDRLERR